MPTRNSQPTLIALIALLFAALACNLISEDSATSEKPLLTEDRPTVLILAPANGNVYAVGAEITFHALARDLGPGVARIEVTIEIPGQPVILIQEAANPAGEPRLEAILKWTADGNQGYLVNFQAFRADGTASAAETTSIMIKPALEATPDLSAVTVEPQPATTEEFGLPADSPRVTGTLNATTPIRQGPGTTYDQLLTAGQGQTFTIVGLSADSAWYALELDTGYGWILAMFVNLADTTITLPVVNAPPQ